ncbi:MAG: acyl-CoA/acyl-ACP dehydrogenase [Proteobacteria bacterium]|nr:acyl-CoA/acyl-ACP dehydrogenase [Pseudomonadota bacterium]
MEFGYSEEQKMLDESIRRFVNSEVPLDRIRELVLEGTGYDDKIWNGLAELGVLGVLIPEEFGGAGMGFLDATIIQESLGYVVAPAPFLGTSVMAPTAILAAGSDDQKNKWLPEIAAGNLKVGLGLTEVTGARENAGVSFSGGKASGKAMFVIDGECADGYILAAGKDTLVWVAAGAAGLTKTKLNTVDNTRGVVELVLDGVEAELIGTQGGEAAAVQKTIDAGRTALAADLLGTSQRMLERAVEYAKERKQFNRVIASFQGLKHTCADMAANLEPCRAMVWYAAHCQQEIADEATLLACQVKSHLSEVSTPIANDTTLVHGGMGFTDLMGLHFWFKRIGLSRQLLGSPEAIREEAAVLQGWVAA